MYLKRIKIIFPLLLLGLMLASTKSALAAPFSQARVRYDRMKAQSPTSVQVLIVPITVGTEAKLKVTFGGLVVGSGVSVSTTDLPSGAIALPGTLTIANVGTSGVLISGVTDLTVGTTYAVNVSAGVSTPSGAQQYLDTVETLTSGDARIDSKVVATRVISDDQLVLTANVPPSFNFVLTGNTDVFTTDLDAGTVSTTNGRTVSVTTNAAKGWIGWVKSSNTALSSVTTGESIATSGTVDGSPSTCSIGTDCYVLDADKTTTGAGTGLLTIDDEYNGGADAGGALSTTLVPFVTRTGKTAGDVITLIAKATIVGTKAAAADYTDTLTVIGAGNF